MSTVAPAPSPALLPRLNGPRPARSFDVASELSDEAVGWCIRDLASGEEAVFIRPRVRGEDVLIPLTKEIAAWVDARSCGEPAVLRCFSVALRDAVCDNLDPARYQLCDLISLNSSAAWGESARVALRRRLTSYADAQFQKRVLYGASDGSVHPVYGNGAYSWVSSDGQWFAARSRANILASEVLGILSFVRHFIHRGDHYRAVLFVDSMQAIEVVKRGRFNHSRVSVTALAEASALIQSGRLELIWVRSHQGHLLNDIADRIALQRHRAVRSELGQEMLDSLCQQIVDGAAAEFAAADWQVIAREARSAYRAHVREQAA